MPRERTVGIVDLERAWLAVVLVRTFLRAHQLAELAHILRRECGSVEAGDAAAFANIADQPVEHLGVGEDRADDAVEKHGVVLLDVRVFQVVEIVVEDRLVGAGVLAISRSIRFPCAMVV